MTITLLQHPPPIFYSSHTIVPPSRPPHSVRSLIHIVPSHNNYDSPILSSAPPPSSFTPPSPLDVFECNIGDSIDDMFLEVALMEVRIHVESRCSEVKCPGYVGDHTLSALSYGIQSHPHVPVP